MLRAKPEKYNTITSSMEQCGDLDTMSLDEAIGSLKIHKDKLQDCEEERERAFLASVWKARVRSVVADDIRERIDTKGSVRRRIVTR